MNPDTICVGCMEDDSGAPVCPKCKQPFDLSARNSLQLKPRTILQEKYLIGRALGHGGFGITYLAWDLERQRRCAIKEYMPNGVAGRATGDTHVLAYSDQTSKEFEWGLNRFMEEAKVLQKFSHHPAIVAVETIFEGNGTAYLVMEYLHGSTLEEYLGRRGGKIPFETATRVMFRVIDALCAVHAEGILHRDISPDNIFLTNDGRVKLIDFGAARNALSQKSRNLSIILKEGYAPEEQYRNTGIQGPWTDVYATAATLYHAVTGTIPQPALDRQVEDRLQRPSALAISLPASGEAALMKALAVRAAERFQSMEDFKEALLGKAVPANIESQPAALDDTVPVGPSAPALMIPAPPAPAAQMLYAPPPPAPQPMQYVPQQPHVTVAPRQQHGSPKWLWPSILAAAAAISVGAVVYFNWPAPVRDDTNKTNRTDRTDQVRTDRTDQIRNDRTDQVRTDQVRTDRTDQVRTDQVRTDRTDQVRTDQVRTDRTDRVKTDKTDRVRTDRTEKAVRTDRSVPTDRGIRTDRTDSGVPTDRPIRTDQTNRLTITNIRPPIRTDGGPIVDTRNTYESLLQTAQRTSNPQEALAILTRAIETNPNDPRGYAQRGHIELYLLNQPGPAQRDYKVAIQRGVPVTFHVIHDDSARMFSKFCQGTLTAGRAGLRYQSNNDRDSFDVQLPQIQEKKPGTGPRVLLQGTPRVTLHFKINGRNYNFAGTSSAPELERDLIFEALGGNAFPGN